MEFRIPISSLEAYSGTQHESTLENFEDQNSDPSESQVETSSTIGGGEDNGTFFRGNGTSR